MLHFKEQKIKAVADINICTVLFLSYAMLKLMWFCRNPVHINYQILKSMFPHFITNLTSSHKSQRQYIPEGRSLALAPVLINSMLSSAMIQEPEATLKA